MAQVFKSVQSEQVRSEVLNLLDLAEQARQIVLDARKEAATIVAAARADVDQVRQQAIQEGREQGLEQGLAQARQEADARLRAQGDELSALMGQIGQELAQARNQNLARMKREMLEFSLALAAKIVGHVAVADIAAAKVNLCKVLDLAACQGEVLLKVNPGQFRRLQEYCEGVSESMGLAGSVRVVADPDVTPGGVEMLSGTGEIDATIETQLNNVVQSLLGTGSLFESVQDVCGTYESSHDAAAAQRPVPIA